VTDHLKICAGFPKEVSDLSPLLLKQRNGGLPFLSRLPFFLSDLPCFVGKLGNTGLESSQIDLRAA